VQLCLIMDEVDGMSAGDRGGVADLIQVRPPAQRLLQAACCCGRRPPAQSCLCGQAAPPAPYAILPKCKTTLLLSPHAASALVDRPLPLLLLRCLQTIHKTRVPIIAICNDKYSMKLKSLRNHTLELEYRK
jgi:hypothetical protein